MSKKKTKPTDQDQGGLMTFSKEPKELDLTGDMLVNYSKFEEEFLIYMKATGLFYIKDEDRKINLLLYIIGHEARDVMKANKITGETLEAVMLKLKQFFDRKEPTLIYCEKFLGTTQEEHESIDDYITRLKDLAAHCGYGAFEERIIRDVFVLGLKNKELKKELVEESELTLEEALRRSRNYGITEESRLCPEENGTPTLETQEQKFAMVTTKPKPKKAKTCWKCEENHPYGQCPAYHKRCFVCERMGHLAKCCPLIIDFLRSDSEDKEEEEESDNTSTIAVGTMDTNQVEVVEAAFSSQEEDDKEMTHTVRQNPDSCKEVPNTSEETEKSDLCEVCFSKRQNGLFVHNNIAHAYGCYNCAKKIFDTNGNCPICRRKTLKVTKLFGY